MAPKLPHRVMTLLRTGCLTAPLERGLDKDIEDERPSWLSEGAWVESAKGGPKHQCLAQKPSCSRAPHGAGTLGLT